MDIDRGYLLSQSALFSELSQSESEWLLKHAHQKSVAAQEVMFYQGDEGHRLYLILSGKIQISASSETGKELTFGILHAGEIFGEIAVFCEEKRTATAMALEKSELLFMERYKLIPLLTQKPDVAIKIIAALCKRLAITSAAMEEILFYSLPTRLAKKLLTLVEIYGQENESGTTIKLRLSQTALGNMVSVSRESINKQMKAWENKELLSCDQGIITIKQLEVMQDIAFNEQ